MARRNTNAMREVIMRMKRGESLDTGMVIELLSAITDAVEVLEDEKEYLEASLVAATRGELPEKFDLNQLLLAQRAKAYLKWLAETKDPRDKLRPAGSNDAMVA